MHIIYTYRKIYSKYTHLCSTHILKYSNIVYAHAGAACACASAMFISASSAIFISASRRLRESVLSRGRDLSQILIVKHRMSGLIYVENGKRSFGLSSHRIRLRSRSYIVAHFERKFVWREAREVPPKFKGPHE